MPLFAFYRCAEMECEVEESTITPQARSRYGSHRSGTKLEVEKTLGVFST